jgi:hypothetical protein
LPPSASASSFPVYVAVAAVGVVVGMVLACLVGLCMRNLWRRRYERKRNVEEQQDKLLTELQQTQPSASVHSATSHVPVASFSIATKKPATAPKAKPPAFDPWRQVLRTSLQRAPSPPARTSQSLTAQPCCTEDSPPRLYTRPPLQRVVSHPITITPSPSPLHSIESTLSTT